MKKHFYFVLNSKGKIELTPQELDQLLDDIYNEGYHDGMTAYPQYVPITTPTYPINPTPYCDPNGTGKPYPDWDNLKWIATTTATSAQ